MSCGVPILALAATVKDSVLRSMMSSLEMRDGHVVSVSPNKENIFYSVVKQLAQFIDDFADLAENLASNSVLCKRVIVY